MVDAKIQSDDVTIFRIFALKKFDQIEYALSSHEHIIPF